MSPVAKQFFTDKGAHSRALFETFVVVTFSLMPLLIVFLSKYFDGYVALDGMSDFISATIGTGELFIYTFSISGSLIWLGFLKGGARRLIFPRKIISLIVCLAIPILAIRVGHLIPLGVLADETVAVSIISFLFAIILYYLLLVFCEIEPPEVSPQLKANAKKMGVDAKEHIGG